MKVNKKHEIQDELKDLGVDFQMTGQATMAVPDAYFEHFNEQLWAQLESDSILESLSTEMPYEVPVGYFDQLNTQVLAQVAQEPASTMMLHRSNKKSSWAMAASIALLLSVGLFFFNQSQNISVTSKLQDISQADLEQYINEHSYEFNDYILEGQTAEIKEVEQDFFKEAQGLSNDELLEFAL